MAFPIHHIHPKKKSHEQNSWAKKISNPKYKAKNWHTVHIPHQCYQIAIANFVQDSRIFSNHESFSGKNLLHMWRTWAAIWEKRRISPEKKQTWTSHQYTPSKVFSYCHKLICGEVSANSIPLHSLAPVNFTLPEEFFSLCSSISSSKDKKWYLGVWLAPPSHFTLIL